jgi:hypothetical protein
MESWKIQRLKVTMETFQGERNIIEELEKRGETVILAVDLDIWVSGILEICVYFILYL